MSFFFLLSPCFGLVVMSFVSYLQSSSLDLCFQDVTLQILRGAQWSNNWTTACTGQTTFLCELHNILLLEEGWKRVETGQTCHTKTRERAITFTVSSQVYIHFSVFH